MSGISINGQVGPVAPNAADGVPINPRLGHTGEIVVQELHGRYFETTARGGTFTATNQAAQAISAALATTYTGLLVYNPPGSGVVLSINKVKISLAAAPAAIAPLGLIQGFSATGGVTAQTTAATTQSNLVGSSKRSSAIVLSAATIVTPTWMIDLADGFTAAALPAPTLPVDLEGLYQILPGGFIAVGALTAVSALSFISWEEVPFNVLG